MKISLIHREKLLPLGQFLVDELDSLVSRIRASWNIEHTPEGGHANVTAQTIASGRLTFSDIAEVTIAEEQVNNFDPAGFSTAGILRLNSELEEVSITGLRVPQDAGGVVLDGRVLVIENVTSDTLFVLESENTFSSPRNRFITPWGPPFDSNSPNRTYLRPSTLTVLAYNAKKARWIVHSQAKDENVKFNFLPAGQMDDWPSGAIRRVGTWQFQFDDVGGSFSGFEGDNVPTTTRIRMVNTGLYKFSILHMNTASAVGNRVQCPGGVQYVLNPRESVDLYKTDTGWRILEKSDQWIDVEYSAANLTAGGGATPTWTIPNASQQVTYAYQLDGNKMTVAFHVQNSTVTGAPTNLRLAIPDGRVAAREIRARLGYALDAGTARAEAFCRVVPGGTVIEIYRDFAITAWTNTGGTLTQVMGEIVFMVRDDSADISEDHTDVAHGDTTHADVDHSDVTHQDVAHGDSHGDSAHTDTSHSDIAHVDAHTDTAHTDEAHEDVAHVDDHSDSAHDDSPHDDAVTHFDAPHADEFEPGHPEHEDSPHEDSTFHGDSHGDTSHGDGHSDTAHADEAHEDVAHVDGHTDTAHSDTAHVDGGHSDVHSDTTPHVDVAHVDVSHGDTPHADVTHQDVGYHTDDSHADQ